MHPPNITTAFLTQSLYGVGGQALFVCRAEGFGSLNFKWQRQRGNIPLSAVVDMNNGTLIIPELSLNDSGNYRCIVSDDWNGTVYSKYLQLNISDSKLTTRLIGEKFF